MNETKYPSNKPPSQLGTKPSTRAAQEIRALMAARRLTSTDLGKHLGVSRSTASRTINGLTTLDLDRISHIAEWLEVDPARITNPEQLAYTA